MSRFRISTAVFALLLVLPASAAAYLAPEDVLQQSQFSPPPSPRQAQSVFEQQQQDSADRRAAALQQLMHGAAPDAADSGTSVNAEVNPQDVQDLLQLFKDAQPGDFNAPDATGGATAPATDTTIPTDTLHGSAPADPAGDSSLTRDERIQSRIDSRMQAEGVSGPVDGNVIQTFHSGAPLSGTGPGLLVFGTALLGAAGVTMKRPGKAQMIKQ